MDSSVMMAMMIGGGAALGLFGTIMLIQTVRRSGRMRINLARTCCPKCAAALPRMRRPTSLRQMMWGGWTCHACGCEVDKSGRKLAH